ncbi:hypothetical protein PI126_g2014 [Phytophthora idaei]|nr:hypothetical protein PI126_g2014 [Phytophthora idaei]
MRSFESNIQDLYREWHRDHEFSKKANERRLLLSHIIVSTGGCSDAGASGNDGDGDEVHMLADDVDAYAVIDSDEEERHEIDSEYYGNVDINIDACDDISSVEDEEAVKADDELLETSQHKTQIKAMKPSGWRYVLLPKNTQVSTKRFWQRFASESNRYHGKMPTQRAAKFQTRQKARRSKDSSVEVPTRKDIRQRLREMKQMEPHELIVALGLVIARMMCPH